MHIEDLRTYCLSLPGATEAIRWEHHLNFYVGEKMFCISTLDADGNVAFKVPDDEYEEIAALPCMVHSPWLSRSKWVLVGNYTDLTDAQWKHYIEQSYRLVRAKLPKKKQAGLPAWSPAK